MQCDICEQPADGRYFGGSFAAACHILNPRSGALYVWYEPVTYCSVCSITLATCPDGMSVDEVVEGIQRDAREFYERLKTLNADYPGFNMKLTDFGLGIDINGNTNTTEEAGP